MFWICTDCTIVCYVKSFSSVSVCVQNNETHLSGWLGTVEFVAPEKIWSKGLNFQKQILQFSFLKGSFYHMNCAFSLEITKDKMEMESDEKSEWRHCRSIELNEDLCLGRVLGSLRESWKVPECPTAPLAAWSSTLSHPFRWRHQKTANINVFWWNFRCVGISRTGSGNSVGHSFSF